MPLWWDSNTVERVVSREFVCSKLIPSEIARLDQPLGFGDGLTDGTYWEWLSEKSKRIFLILVDLGMPDQIFGIIDDSWDDDDLPIALDQVERLDLTAQRDEKIEKKFYRQQFFYLLKHVTPGEHTIYQDDEVVPIEVLDRLQSGVNLTIQVDKVELPNAPGKQLCRRKIPLGTGTGYMTEEVFLAEVTSINAIQNDHIVSYYASYTHQGHGYVLLSPVSDFTLRSFLASIPSSIKMLDKHLRRRMIMDWIHCLIDTLCFLHHKGLSFGNIRPSTILINHRNHIFFSDCGGLNPESLASIHASSFDKEVYDYAAPEQWFRPTSPATTRKATLTSMSCSPDNTVFSISRGTLNTTSLSNMNSDNRPLSPQAVLAAPTPHLNPQAADVFSFGCIILELLSHLLKRQSRNFASHRSAKHRAPGRGGAVLDSSFHKNLGQVEVWMSGLARDAIKKKDDPIFKGIAPILHVVERMLALHPNERPSAFDVQTRMYQILTDNCGITEPHCVHQYGGFDFGIGSLRLASSPRSPMSPSDLSALSRQDSYATSRNQQVVLTKTPSSPSISSSAEHSSSAGTKRSSVWSHLGHRRTSSGGSGGAGGGGGGGGSGNVTGFSNGPGPRVSGSTRNAGVPSSGGSHANFHTVSHMNSAPSPWFYSNGSGGGAKKAGARNGSAATGGGGGFGFGGGGGSGVSNTTAINNGAHPLPNSINVRRGGGAATGGEEEDEYGEDGDEIGHGIYGSALSSPGMSLGPNYPLTPGRQPTTYTQDAELSRRLLFQQQQQIDDSYHYNRGTAQVAGSPLARSGSNTGGGGGGGGQHSQHPQHPQHQHHDQPHTRTGQRGPASSPWLQSQHSSASLNTAAVLT